MKSSISALPGPVSKAIIASAPSRYVKLATPPTLSTAVGPGRSRFSTSARWNTGTSGAPCPPAATSAARKSNATGRRSRRASSLPLPSCTLRPASGRCSTVCPWNPTTAMSFPSPSSRRKRPAARRSARSSQCSPRRSRSARRPRRRARSRSSGRWHGRAPCGVPRLNPTGDLLHHRPARVELPRRAFARQGTAMSAHKSEFLRVLGSRGFIHQVSEPEALDRLAQSSAITGYIGFDCTAPSLHVGNLVSIMMLYWMQQTGHRPIALMGGGTTRVGDPSGKDESRKLLDEAMIARNLRGIRAVFDKFLTFGEGSGDALMANNADWLNTLNYIDFLREVGRHFSVNRMLSFESIKLRLERQQELSFLEFNYMILQAYDFVELYQRHGCVLKMGKTAAGAVWLNADMVSPYDYWQFWRNTEDADVGRFLKLFTILAPDEADRLASLQGQEINEAKKVLATEATALVHGRPAAEAAAKTARTTFEEGG